MNPDELKAFIETITERRGSNFVALCAMLARLSHRDIFRGISLMRNHAREKLTEAENDIMRHLFFNRPDLADNLKQFRRLYGRLADIACVAGAVVDFGECTNPEQTAEFLADLATLAIALIGNRDPITANLPPSMRTGATQGVWDGPETPEAPPDKVDRDNPKNYAEDDS